MDLANLSDEELTALWILWLEQAQATNEDDADTGLHICTLAKPSVFEVVRCKRK